MKEKECLGCGYKTNLPEGYSGGSFVCAGCGQVCGGWSLSVKHYVDFSIKSHGQRFIRAVDLITLLFLVLSVLGVVLSVLNLVLLLDMSYGRDFGSTLVQIVKQGMFFSHSLYSIGVLGVCYILRKLAMHGAYLFVHLCTKDGEAAEVKK